MFTPYPYVAGGVTPGPTPLPTSPGVLTTNVYVSAQDADGVTIVGPDQYAAGITVQRQDGPGQIVIPGAVLALTDGRTATGRAVGAETKDLVLFDLAQDWAKASRIALARADQAPPAALAAAAGLFQALGKTVCVLDDIPGLIAARTVAMLANEAADAVNQAVADAGAVDLAMQKGVNYPRGPLAWADDLGPAWVLAVIDNLAAAYGEDRYRASPLLRRVAARGGAFHKAKP